MTLCFIFESIILNYPYFLISGKTFEVIQRLNFLDVSNFEVRTREYKPDSFNIMGGLPLFE